MAKVRSTWIWLPIGLALLASACSKVPERDEFWLEETVPVGIPVAEFTQLLTRRGFKPNERYSRSQSTWRGGEFGSIGMRDIKSDPGGAVVCYSKPYTYMVASGDRLICFSKTKENTVRWRQASFFGAGI